MHIRTADGTIAFSWFLHHSIQNVQKHICGTHKLRLRTWQPLKNNCKQDMGSAAGKVWFRKWCNQSFIHTFRWTALHLERLVSVWCLPLGSLMAADCLPASNLPPKITHAMPNIIHTDLPAGTFQTALGSMPVLRGILSFSKYDELCFTQFFYSLWVQG